MNRKQCHEWKKDLVELHKVKKENKQLKLSNICIPCPDDDCCGVLTTEKYIDRPTCNECGKVYVLELQYPKGAAK